jgi:Skp family chaperone for outer membrane proteins
MTLPRALTALSLAAALCCAAVYLASPAPSAAAQAQGQAQSRPIRVAVANTMRIFNELQETKDVEARLLADRQALAAQEKPMQEKLKTLEAEKANFRPDSPQYEQWQSQYLRAANEHKLWAQIEMGELDWKRKRQTRAIYRRIYDAVQQYAEKEGIDLVLSDHQPTLGDKEMASVPFDQMATLMNQRRVLYASKAADISDKIIALMDTRYKQNPAANAGGAR